MAVMAELSGAGARTASADCARGGGRHGGGEEQQERGQQKAGADHVAPTVAARRWLRTQGAGYTERSASVGDSRAARSAGYSPATAPMTSAAASPPASASGGTTAGRPWVAA